MQPAKDPLLYTLAFESKVDPSIKIYVPAENTSYHKCREMAAHAQNIFSGAGITKEMLVQIIDHVLDKCNDEKDVKRLRTDVATIMNGLKYRTAYPIDEDCAIRMGAILSFLEEEDPNECHASTTKRKIELAKTKDPELYTFFLDMGLQFTHAYLEQSAHLNDSEYFQNRNETLRTLAVQ